MDYQVAASQRVFAPLIIPAAAGNPFQFVFTTQDGTPLQGNGSQVFPPAVLPPGQSPPFGKTILTVRAEWDQTQSVTFPSVVYRQYPQTRFIETAPQDQPWANGSAVFQQFQQPVATQLARTILTAQETQANLAGSIFTPFNQPPNIGPFLRTLLSTQDPLPYDLQIAASQAVFNAAAFSIPIIPPVTPPVPQAGGSAPGHTGGKRKRKKDSGPYMREDQVFGEEYPVSPSLTSQKDLNSAGKSAQVTAANGIPDYRDTMRMLLRELL
jgi:hypothetical protein